MKRFLTIFVLCLTCFLIVNVALADKCTEMKDTSDDPPLGKKTGDRNDKYDPEDPSKGPEFYGEVWTTWDAFCAACPGETCCGKNKVCDCACSTNYCAKDAKDGKMKCMLYASSCGCYDSGLGMVCGKNPFGKIVCADGTTFQDKCKNWVQGLWRGDYKGCVKDDQCVNCPPSAPNYPSSKCVDKKCVKSYECGTNGCSSDADCCGKTGESNPHYECDTKQYTCSLVNTCGKNQCNPKEDKYSEGLNRNFNPKCIKYTCDQNAWKCSYDSSGSFFGKDACTTGCIKGYTCDTTNWQCKVTMGGKYTKESDCTSICKAPEPKYSCNTTLWKCEANTKGSNLSDCNKQCVNPEKPSTKYSCNKADGKCAIDANGKYADEWTCKVGCFKVVNPPPTVPKYGCNDSKKCVIAFNGTFTTPNCDNRCSLPNPPVIPEACDIREFNVTPSVLGITRLKDGSKWFVLDWMTNGLCNSCDISIAPLDSMRVATAPFSIVKDNLGNTGTLDDKELKLSGLYKYKLTCYGDLDTPDKDVTVRVLPFIIWYEVNPVMPSRFRNVGTSAGWKN